MIKKFILLSLVASQLMISCSSDDSNDKPETEQTVEEQIAELLKKPYSSLTPAQQKTKLEAEANDMLTQLDKTKSSSAIEALENLSRLLDINHIDIFNGKNSNQVEDILNISGVYGVYTWNNTNKVWVKTASTTELKFVFPAKESQTANNAVFTSKAVSSDVKVDFFDGYNGNASVYDTIFLPSSSDATLTIDNTQSATFTQTAKYSSKNQSPDEFAYKMTLNDGYTWEMSGKKGTENTSKAVLTYNGKNLIDFSAGSNAEIDKLIDNDELVQYRGKANGLFKLMDNFVIVADMDLATEAADKEALYKANIRPKSPDYSDPKADFKAYYTASNAYEKKISEGNAANFNKNMKLILVSKKDGTKIADIVQHSEKDGEYTFNLPVWNAQSSYWNFWNPNGETFTQPYLYDAYYLKFNDNTEVEMSVYFSEGFEKFEAKFEDFIAAFEKK
ncbi:hypothetical protein [Flavobacterium quisquiliarum]|uniref:Lipoprotein n=1 Tax=Flavobacterium quisquiliarum TaxID=1834436 RepID=A0ABV8W6E7_9FLAO|nr:hypothetical protein [Flavobacterium quisquiliarum]MBW1657082.1 hypothetical protein [Flavobacterium quisquiliarum]NWK99748.1 hypothetical protein [Flavobacterium collinsii]